MDPSENPCPAPRPRRDGWTPERRSRFLASLAAGADVRRACAEIGMSRQAAYCLRRRDPAFARVWDGALRTAREADARAFLAGLPEKLLRTMSELSAPCKLQAGNAAQDPVRVVGAV